MLDLLAPALPLEQGEVLTDEAYVRDFRERRSAIRNGDSWKLERLQHFEEEDNPSRDAMRRGDWEAALRLMEGRADDFRRAAEADAHRGSRFHRVRVVEEPLTPYLQWELHLLRQRALRGHRIRVVPAEALLRAETGGLLPELTILDDRALFRVLYSESGVAEGAIRFTDPDIVLPWAAFISDAYAAGEDVTAYFDRAVADLPPPPAA